MESSTALADINPEKDGSQETIPSMSSQEILDFEKCLDNYSPALAGSQSESSVKSSVTITENLKGMDLLSQVYFLRLMKKNCHRHVGMLKPELMMKSILFLELLLTQV